MAFLRRSVFCGGVHELNGGESHIDQDRAKAQRETRALIGFGGMSVLCGLALAVALEQVPLPAAQVAAVYTPAPVQPKPRPTRPQLEVTRTQPQLELGPKEPDVAPQKVAAPLPHRKLIAAPPPAGMARPLPRPAAEGGNEPLVPQPTQVQALVLTKNCDRPLCRVKPVARPWPERN